MSRVGGNEREELIERLLPEPIAPVDEPTKREPAKRRRKVTGEGGREASVVVERRKKGGAPNSSQKPQKRPHEGVEEGRWRAWVSAKTHHNYPQPAKREDARRRMMMMMEEAIPSRAHSLNK